MYKNQYIPPPNIHGKNTFYRNNNHRSAAVNNLPNVDEEISVNKPKISKQCQAMKIGGNKRTFSTIVGESPLSKPIFEVKTILKKVRYRNIEWISVEKSNWRTSDYTLEDETDLIIKKFTEIMRKDINIKTNLQRNSRMFNSAKFLKQNKE